MYPIIRNYTYYFVGVSLEFTDYTDSTHTTIDFTKPTHTQHRPTLEYKLNSPNSPKFDIPNLFH